MPLLLIDAGHGLTDPGAVGNGIIEKDYTLKITLYQLERFKQLGVDVAATRTNDKTINPGDRARLVRSYNAQFCISNHINAGGGDGAEIIHSIHATDKLSQAIKAEFVNRGQNVRRIFTRTLPSDKKKDYYYMHRETGATETVIIEYGFLDSKGDDVEQIKNNWQNYAEGVVKAFCQYIKHPYQPPKQTEKEEKGKLYRIQLGAFSVKGNAEKLLEDVKKAGFKDAFIKHE